MVFVVRILSRQSCSEGGNGFGKKGLDVFPQPGLVHFDREEVIPFPLKDRVTNLLLGKDGVSRDHRSRQGNLLKESQRRVDFVALLGNFQFLNDPFQRFAISRQEMDARTFQGSTSSSTLPVDRHMERLLFSGASAHPTGQCRLQRFDV